jgi:hypothetical protein
VVPCLGEVFEVGGCGVEEHGQLLVVDLLQHEPTANTHRGEGTVD